MSEKTHEASPQRLREARRQGRVPQSRVLVAAAATSGALVGTLCTHRDTSTRLLSLTVSCLSLAELRPVVVLWEGLRLLATAVGPPLGGALAGALLASLATSGLAFNFNHVVPQLERMDLLRGAGQLVTLRRGLDVLKGFSMACAVGVLMWFELRGAAPLLAPTLSHEGGEVFSTELGVLAAATSKTAALLSLLGILDLALARRRHRRDLRMSHDEVKREQKSSEGDPSFKAQRQALHRQLAHGGSARGLSRATALVVNPTHVAVALRYDESECDAPYLVAKARNADARGMRAQARRLGVPIIKDVALARTLVHCDVGEPVPEELYLAAAAVLKVALSLEDGPRDRGGDQLS